MKDMDEELIDDLRIASRQPDLDPRVICARLLEECPEFGHLKEGEVDICWIESVEGMTDKGRHVLGMVHEPKVQGKLSSMFSWMLRLVHGADPDFIIRIDAPWWAVATPMEREILVYHELSHIAHAEDKDGEPKYNDDTGRPVYCIVGHDIEEFSNVARRYGAWSADLQNFAQALKEGTTA